MSNKTEISILDAQVGSAVILGPGHWLIFLLFMGLVAVALWKSYNCLIDFLPIPLKTLLQQHYLL